MRSLSYCFPKVLPKYLDDLEHFGFDKPVKGFDKELYQEAEYKIGRLSQMIQELEFMSADFEDDSDEAVPWEIAIDMLHTCKDQLCCLRARD